MPLPCPRTGKSERGGSDDAQCAFAADKQMARVVAGGVYAGMEMGNQFAVGEDDFKPITRSRIVP